MRRCAQKAHSKAAFEDRSSCGLSSLVAIAGEAAGGEDSVRNSRSLADKRGVGKMAEIMSPEASERCGGQRCS